MSTYEWLLALHVTGAFLLVGGATAAAILTVLAQRSRRPSEIALLLSLVRIVVPVIGLGALLTLVLGLWLVRHVGYSYGAFWVWSAIALWLIGNALGGPGGRRQGRARKLARWLAEQDDTATDELLDLLSDRAGNALSWGSGAAFLLILVLMIWKPGA